MPISVLIRAGRRRFVRDDPRNDDDQGVRWSRSARRFRVQSWSWSSFSLRSTALDRLITQV
eukprot:2274205-Pyramimonas_sp.AAC.1